MANRIKIRRSKSSKGLTVLLSLSNRYQSCNNNDAELFIGNALLAAV